jgi:hypothetical protein
MDYPNVELILPQWFQLARKVALLQYQSRQLPMSDPPSRVHMREIDDIFLYNYFSGILQLHFLPTWTISPTIHALSTCIALCCGQRLYATIEDTFYLPCRRTTHKALRREGKPKFNVGVNLHIYKREAALVYNKKASPNITPLQEQEISHEWLINMGDGTRAVRAIEPWDGRLVGNVFSPDVDLWPKEPGLPIPLNYEDCATVIRALRGKNCLAHEASLTPTGTVPSKP